jgi:hypothetical protein
MRRAATTIKPGRVHIPAFEANLPAAVIVRLDRTIQYYRGGSDRAEKPRRTGPPVKPEDDSGLGAA